ncbi:HAD family hydrolase [Rhizobium sp. C4]|uniref:HAD family hydrolase n=1 Tax=Rhizobium sp. C4 TaxID=1349800 RepID=UPI001E655152|nr:HAD family hydrolase [Rhizobium sp. C4]MCD2173529.1 HAD family hydrolase [Rhizobium sp. C4]
MSAPEEGKWLIVSDIDDTLTGDREALESLWLAVRRQRMTVCLALNSSRPAESVDRTIRSYFPSDFTPRAIITGLGTEIRIDGQFVPEWAHRFAAWPRQEIVDVVRRFGHQAHADEFQTPGKASFSVPDRASVEAVLAELSARRLPAQALYTGKSDLDLIAPEAGKDLALLFLARQLRIPAGRVIAAGDSGNDLAMFEAADRAIAVGNARPELVHTAPRYKTYFARAPHAAGVLEGLQAYGVLAS